MTKTIIKRTFKVTTGVTPETVDAAMERVRHYPGVISASGTGRHITIEYVLGDCSYTTIRQYLAELQLPLVAGILTKLKKDWVIFTEDNALANLALPAGWPQHVQNLYLSLHTSDRKLTR